MSTAVDRLVEAERLPADYREVVDKFWRPLSEEIAARYAGKPLIVGINGGQGSGKTTVAKFLEVLLVEHNQVGITLSLDDFAIALRQPLGGNQRGDRVAHAILSGSGRPSAQAITLASARSPIAMRVSRVALPRCGRRTTFSRPTNSSGTVGSAG